MRLEEVQGKGQESAVVICFGGLERGFFFALHVFVLDGVEDVAAALALDILGVFIAGDDAHNGVFAGGEHGGKFSDRRGPDASDSAATPALCQSRK